MRPPLRPLDIDENGKSFEDLAKSKGPPEEPMDGFKNRTNLNNVMPIFGVTADEGRALILIFEGIVFTQSSFFDAEMVF